MLQRHFRAVLSGRDGRRKHGLLVSKRDGKKKENKKKTKEREKKKGKRKREKRKEKGERRKDKRGKIKDKKKDRKKKKEKIKKKKEKKKKRRKKKKKKEKKAEEGEHLLMSGRAVSGSPSSFLSRPHRGCAVRNRGFAVSVAACHADVLSRRLANVVGSRRSFAPSVDMLLSAQHGVLQCMRLSGCGCHWLTACIAIGAGKTAYQAPKLRQ